MATDGRNVGRARRLTGTLIALSITGMALGSVPVAAHSSETTADGIPFAVVLGLSAAVGGGVGMIAVYWRWNRLSGHLTHGHVSGLIGAALVGLAALFMIPAARREPSAVPIGLLLGGVVVYSILRYRDLTTTSFVGDTTVADTVSSAVWVHRFVEGVALAAAYQHGFALGVVAAIILTIHMMVEMATVGGLYATAGTRLRGLGAVILVQLGYVLAAATTTIAAVSLAPTIDAFMLVTAGSVLFFFGVHGCRTCVSPTGSSP